jgi:hypothetical protein
MKSDEQIREEFDDVVNMSAAELEEWLNTENSQSVGLKHDGDDESIGHQSGRHIIDILRTDQRDLDAEHISHMRKVVGYVRRHSAQRPDGDVTQTRWRYSLMNWGHDPLKD